MELRKYLFLRDERQLDFAQRAGLTGMQVHKAVRRKFKWMPLSVARAIIDATDGAVTLDDLAPPKMEDSP